MKNIERLFNIIDRALFRTDSTLDYDRTLEALERLAELVNECDDVNWYLGECGSCTLDGMLVGAYWYCVENHRGQWSDEYRLQCRIGSFFQPNCTTLEEDTSEADVYSALSQMNKPLTSN